MIGGEFEIDLSTRSDSFVPMPNTYYYYATSVFRQVPSCC